MMLTHFSKKGYSRVYGFGVGGRKVCNEGTERNSGACSRLYLQTSVAYNFMGVMQAN